MNIVPNIRLYLTVGGKKTALPAGEVALGIDDAEALSLIARDVAREATAGEVAVTTAEAEESKPKRAKKAKVEKAVEEHVGEDTIAAGEGEDTVAAGEGEDTVAAVEGEDTDINDLA